MNIICANFALMIFQEIKCCKLLLVKHKKKNNRLTKNKQNNTGKKHMCKFCTYAI